MVRATLGLQANEKYTHSNRDFHTDCEFVYTLGKRIEGVQDHTGATSFSLQRYV
ncbi:hypothetical protein SDC9_102276 [bioreactor metagenome]|uniref:Uncharacterized protein n=1 Tax=bioreactor metagenome TaxID=1076179 RepID=A0A645AQX1_9ZZZZ